mmetsp:Transcript_78736/g.205357  ORF Transcript_78736/g.205357 Transcript_78736/m.205357 type:complete len:375 (+) Transcript_78736:131-1255(+)
MQSLRYGCTDDQRGRRACASAQEQSTAPLCVEACPEFGRALADSGDGSQLQARIDKQLAAPVARQARRARGQVECGVVPVVSEGGLHILADHLLGLDETVDLVVEHAFLLLEALHGPRDHLLEFLLLVSRQLFLLLPDHAQAVHLRGQLQGRRLPSYRDLVHCVLGGLGGALRVVQLRRAPHAVLLAHPGQLLEPDPVAPALALPLRQLLLGGPLFLEDAVERRLLALLGYNVRSEHALGHLAHVREVLDSQRVRRLVEVDSHQQVLSHLSRGGWVQRLNRLVDVTHQTADVLGMTRLLHSELPDALLGLLCVGPKVVQDLSKMPALALQPLDVRFRIRLALHLLRQLPDGDLQSLELEQMPALRGVGGGELLL